jgi:hypothetical protein
MLRTRAVEVSLWEAVLPEEVASRSRLKWRYFFTAR